MLRALYKLQSSSLCNILNLSSYPLPPLPYLFVAQNPVSGQGHTIVEVSRSHNHIGLDTHSVELFWTRDRFVTRPLRTQRTVNTNIHATSGIWIRDPSN